jgi:formylglycine-generating enzyme required for sulfatase activity
MALRYQSPILKKWGPNQSFPAHGQTECVAGVVGDFLKPLFGATVDSFRMDRTPVTNLQFRKFIEATGYVTLAEIAPDPKDYPGALPHMLKAGSLVFTPPDHPVDLSNFMNWWTFKIGANWRRRPT